MFKFTAHILAPHFYTTSMKIFYSKKPQFYKVVLLFFLLAIILCLSKYIGFKKHNTRDYNYEAYCDSIWYTNRDYYLEVIANSEKYQQYIEENGEWWNK